MRLRPGPEQEAPSKYAAVIRRAQEKRAEIAGQQRRARQPYSPLAAQEERALKEQRTFKRRRAQSVRFYTSIGYEEYGGRYDPFKIPKGYQVQDITEKDTALSISLEQAPEPKGIAESIMSWRIPWALTEKQKKIMAPTGKKEIQPTHVAAGAIASVEAPVYTLGRLVGFKTPRPPPTVSGGLISSAYETIASRKKGRGGLLGLTRKQSLIMEPSGLKEFETPIIVESKEAKQAKRYGPGYTYGTVLGDIAATYLGGKAAGKITEKVSLRAQKWLTGRWLKAREAGQLSWKGRPEKIVMKLTGAKPHIATQLVAPPVRGPVGLSQLKGQILAWELGATPRTALVTVAKPWATRTAYRLSVGKSITPMAVTLGKALRSEGLMSAPKQIGIQISRRGLAPSLPYIPTPTLGSITRAAPAAGKLVGLAGLLGLKTAQALSLQALSMPRIIQAPRLKRLQRTGILQSQRADMLQSLQLQTGQLLQLETGQKEIQLQLPKQIQAQKTRQITKLIRMPGRGPGLPHIPPVIPGVPTLELEGWPGRKRRVQLRGRWFKLLHAVPTAREISRRFGLKLKGGRKLAR